MKNSSFRLRFANARARIEFDSRAGAAQSKRIRAEPGGNRPARSIVRGACAAKGGWIGGQDRAGSRDALAYRPPSFRPFRPFRALDRGRNDEGDPVAESPSCLLPGPGIDPGLPLPQCGRPDSFTACRNHFG
ncbi:hypothetical protein [Burkholderia gladioli]|uniref:hypothetical protein n=1 Tax=Burkholderia gladioli TaxID=28095 RepID=UPI00163FAB84|nr:hypothetical protein [Burkholderia gladioli]MDA0570564.1 hypothetical protein [Burkholderia gladioli]MDA0598375.1 hypothetical protein [Burkholderia gladioli]